MEQKICIITGASRGLGYSLAREYKNKGFFVIGLARKKEALERLKKENLLSDCYACDLSKREDIDSFINYIESRYKKIDLLVLNAGVQSNYSILESCSYYSFITKETKVNFFAPVQIVSGLIGLLEKSQTQIIIITSLLQLAPKFDSPGYCSSKASLSSWLKNLRLQVKATKIKVTEVIPGLIKTTMTKKAQKDGVPPELLAKEIIKQQHKDLIILKGAKLPWSLSRIIPSFIENKIMKGN